MRRELVKIKMSQKTHVTRVTILLHLQMTKRSIINNGLISIQVSLNVTNKLIQWIWFIVVRLPSKLNSGFDVCWFRILSCMHLKFQTQTFFKQILREGSSSYNVWNLSVWNQIQRWISEIDCSFNSKFWPTFYFYLIIFTATNQKVMISYISAFVQKFKKTFESIHCWAQDYRRIRYNMLLSC